jgi:hypothetical protein
MSRRVSGDRACLVVCGAACHDGRHSTGPSPGASPDIPLATTDRLRDQGKASPVNRATVLQKPGERVAWPATRPDIKRPEPIFRDAIRGCLCGESYEGR